MSASATIETPSRAGAKGAPRALAQPRLSVVIPHLNEPGDLRRCLAALGAQDAADIPFEVIVVDNGSRELPQAVCDEGGARLELEREPGPGPARNHGAGLARAEILAFIDSDCIPDSAWVRTVVGLFEADAGLQCIAGDIRIERRDPRRPTAVEAYEEVFSYRVKRYVEHEGFATTGNMAVRRATFRAVGTFGGIGMMEDRDWGRRATARGVRIRFAPDVRVRTASCRSFAELTRRWDRHIAQEFKAGRPGVRTTAAWLARTCLVAGSPIGEIRRIATSDRLAGVGERAAAFACMARVRFYRATKMLEVALKRDAGRMATGWNRD